MKRIKYVVSAVLTLGLFFSLTQSGPFFYKSTLASDNFVIKKNAGNSDPDEKSAGEDGQNDFEDQACLAEGICIGDMPYSKEIVSITRIFFQPFTQIIFSPPPEV